MEEMEENSGLKRMDRRRAGGLTTLDIRTSTLEMYVTYSVGLGKNVMTAAKPKTAQMLERSRANFRSNSVRARMGSNLEFIATYLFTHLGATSTEVRKALCRARGKEYNRGIYIAYFAKRPHASRPKAMAFADRYWTKKDGGWYLTTLGMGLVQLKGETYV